MKLVIRYNTMININFMFTCLQQFKILEFMSIIKIEFLSKSAVTKLQCDCSSKFGLAEISASLMVCFRPVR